MDSFWIGASDTDSEGVLKWVTSKTDLTFLNWSLPNPDDWKNNED